MFKANHSHGHAVFIDMLFGLLMRRRFRTFSLKKRIALTDGPVLLIANHSSWWDGFVARKVNKKVLQRRFHVMMLEEELKKRPFLGKLGAFSIKKKSRSAFQSLHYASAILQQPGNMLLLFPQGTFQSSHRYPLQFEKGWFRIIDNASDRLQIVFMATLCDYFEYRKPSLNIYLAVARQERNKLFCMDGGPGPHTGALSFYDAESAEKAYNAFLKEAVNEQDRDRHTGG